MIRKKKVAQEDISDIADLLIEQDLLESELEIVNCRLNRLLMKIRMRLAEAESHATKKDLVGEISKAVDETIKKKFSEYPQAMRERREEIEKVRAEVEDAEVYVDFDTPKPLFFRIRISDLRYQNVDIIGSIKANIRNLGHPMILKAIERYRHAARTFKKPPKGKRLRMPVERERLTGETAYQCLERIAEAIRYAEDPNLAFRPFSDYLEPWKITQLEIKHFERISEVLRSKEFQSLTTVSNKIIKVQRELKKEFEGGAGVDELCKWIGERLKTNKFPNRKTSKTLQNDFLSWKLGIKTGSARVYKSQAKRIRDEIYLTPASVPALQKESMAVLDHLTGMKAFSGAVSTFELLTVPQTQKLANNPNE